MSTQTTDLAAWLNSLDEARKAATPGPWEVATAPSEDSTETHAQYLTNALRPDEGRPLWVAWAPASEDLHPGCDYVVPVITGDGPTSEANARFIAEAYTALPELVAALRGVLALHKSRAAGPLAGYCAGCGYVSPCPTYRAVVAAAHTEEV